MFQFSDTNLTISVEGARLTQADKILLTIRQGKKEITLVPTVIGDEDMTATLTQEQTAEFDYTMPARAQLNVWENGKREKISYIEDIPVFENLLKKVITDV